MPDTPIWGTEPVPTAPEAADIPKLFMDYANAVSAKMVRSVASIAERDSKYNGFPAGGVVTCAPLKSMWMSLGMINGVQAWYTIISDTGLVTTGFSWSASWADAGTTRMRKIGHSVEVDIYAVYSGDDIGPAASTGSNAGNLTDTSVVTIPNYRPAIHKTGSAVFPRAGGDCLLAPYGLVFITDLHSGATITSGDTLRVSFNYLVD